MYHKEQLGELNYLRGGRTTGTDLGGAGGFLPGGAMGRKDMQMVERV